MKTMLRKIFWPVLAVFEKGAEDYVVKSSHRKILLAVGVLFVILSSAGGYFLQYQSDKGFYFPVILFLLAGLVCLIIGSLGTDRAVAKIWGSK